MLAHHLLTQHQQSPIYAHLVAKFVCSSDIGGKRGAPSQAGPSERKALGLDDNKDVDEVLSRAPHQFRASFELLFRMIKSVRGMLDNMDDYPSNFPVGRDVDHAPVCEADVDKGNDKGGPVHGADVDVKDVRRNVA